ncbi:hypothetical protein TNIN_436181 [Trichonephila inaurata madagascariensis]|uniref:Uncharacterized protein n=1 Tax=Trichonephila inaurata madagascariensis TaxID=2747483 RepID=A0A8X6XY04_9ARAC|nr:hypothetical protein TNIN_436181 [Trichonephila inaurata madagascariensis]
MILVPPRALSKDRKRTITISVHRKTKGSHNLRIHLQGLSKNINEPSLENFFVASSAVRPHHTMSFNGLLEDSFCLSLLMTQQQSEIFGVVNDKVP